MAVGVGAWALEPLPAQYHKGAAGVLAGNVDDVVQHAEALGGSHLIAIAVRELLPGYGRNRGRAAAWGPAQVCVEQGVRRAGGGEAAAPGFDYRASAPARPAHGEH